MQDKLRANSRVLNDSKDELRLRQVAQDVLKPAPPEAPQTISAPKKATAAVAFGSEYWLP